ncbi:MAG TPA: hypothetical protein VE864_14675, partial [Streptosporangiaceae bacterium]|nr:hypothetical protein [Streptosporangiaceae bacterium]
GQYSPAADTNLVAQESLYLFDSFALTGLEYSGICTLQLICSRLQRGVKCLGETSLVEFNVGYVPSGDRTLFRAKVTARS